MWSESGLHATEYTGVPKNNTQPVTCQIIAGLICLGEDADIHVQSKLLRLNISKL